MEREGDKDLTERQRFDRKNITSYQSIYKLPRIDILGKNFFLEY